MGENKSRTSLAEDIEHYLALLSKLYVREGGQHLKLELLVNAHVRLQANTSYDNWNGGVSGHSLFLIVSQELYLRSLKQKDKLQTAIAEDLNALHNFSSEHIDEILIEAEKEDDRDWRRKSGALRAGRGRVPPTAAQRIWTDTGYRVFLSHKSKVKVSELKRELKPFGISCFVAHEDIKPTKEWQDEIENALLSMDAFVALLTTNFHLSVWTDQEVGFAMARGVPVISVKLGTKDPYGFMGRYQALSSDWAEASAGIAGLLIQEEAMLDAYIDALPTCHSFTEGNRLACVFPHITALTEDQARRMANAFNRSYELQGSWGFNGARKPLYGEGLPALLTRTTGNLYKMDEDEKIAIPEAGGD